MWFQSFFFSSVLVGGEWFASRLKCLMTWQGQNWCTPNWVQIHLTNYQPPIPSPNYHLLYRFHTFWFSLPSWDYKTLEQKVITYMKKFIIWRRCKFTCSRDVSSNQTVSNCEPLRYPFLHCNIHKATLTDPILKHTAPHQAFTGLCAVQRKIAKILSVNQEIS